MRAPTPPANSSSCIYYSACRLCVGSQLPNLLVLRCQTLSPCPPFPYHPLKNTGFDTNTFFELHCSHSHTFSHFSAIQDHSAFLVTIFQDNSLLLIHTTPSFFPMYCISLDPHSETIKLLKS